MGSTAAATTTTTTTTITTTTITATTAATTRRRTTHNKDLISKRNSNSNNNQALLTVDPDILRGPHTHGVYPQVTCPGVGNGRQAPRKVGSALYSTVRDLKETRKLA